MITCDYLIIGAGFAGIGLKYKLLGKVVLIDEHPFRYKIGESQVPILVNADPGLFSLIPKIMAMKSYTRKLGTIFCDSYHGPNASSFPTSLGTSFAWHCEREEIEKLLVKELSIEIRRERILTIDLDKNIVKTNLNTYRFRKYVLDCSGPAMRVAHQLNLVEPVSQFNGMKAQWGYWTIDRLHNDADSWAHWTVINKIGKDSWIWQIPLYNSSILSMGLLHRGQPLSNEDFIKHVEKYSARCYQLTSIAQNPDRAIKSYMGKIYSRLHYSKRSRLCAGKNWILVGDAYCFADPVYSVGSGVAMLEAITIANNLNQRGGELDYSWYEKSCNALLKTVIKGIDTWYSGTAFDRKVNRGINKTILQCGFSKHFRPSAVTEIAKQLQNDNLDVFLPSIDRALFAGSYLRNGVKVYSFDKSLFIRSATALFINFDGKRIRITSKAVRELLQKRIIGKKLSFPELFLLAELNLSTLKDRVYFWKLIRLVELSSLKNGRRDDRLYYFHPEKYEVVDGVLRLGDQANRLVVADTKAIKFFEQLKGRIYAGQELVTQADKLSLRSARVEKITKDFINTFHACNTFGQSMCFAGSQR